jgi:hypothetical protein
MLKQIVRTCFVTLLAAGTVSFAQDGAATYKGKCQMCTGQPGWQTLRQASQPKLGLSMIRL